MDSTQLTVDKSQKIHRKKKKRRARQADNSSSTSDSLSGTLPLLPENTTKPDDLSDSSTISEHLTSISSASVENDCSYEEVEISFIPNSPPIHNASEDEVETDFNHDIVQSILREIIENIPSKSDSEHTVVDSNESFNLFEGVDLNDSLINVDNNIIPKSDIDNLDKVGTSTSRLKQLEELVNSKDDAIAALQVELESLRELTSSNQSTLSLNTCSTEYKLYHEEFQNRIVEYQNALVHRDTIIQQLTEGLQQSVINREQLQDQSQQFSKEIIQLKSQLVETTAIINRLNLNMPGIDSQTCFVDCGIQTDKLTTLATENILDSDSNKNLEEQCSLLEETLNASQIDLLNKIRRCLNVYLDQKMSEYRNVHHNELKLMEDKLENEKFQYQTEMIKLQDLLSSLQCDQADILAVRQGLEAKHAQELEELRTYFEKKCSDLEKHYSEEVFSQHSRKLSDSTSSLEISDFICSGSLPMHGPGGDTEPLYADESKIAQINYSDINKSDLLKLKTTVHKISRDLDKYNIENISKQELHNLKDELEKHGLINLLQFDIVALKNELENKYHMELEILNKVYENKIDKLNVENSNHVQSLEKKYLDQIDSLKLELANTDQGDGMQEVIEAADKKLRATSQFLEEQAAEREQERDEAQKEIATLREQLREREKDRLNCDLIYNEVEQLEQKMRQMSNLLEENDKRLNEVESEKKEAIEKVFFLRDIIRGLENELETKTQTETKLRDSISQLKDIIQQQNKLNEELGQRLGLLTSTSEAEQYQEHICHLEDEVQRLRINKEFAGSEGALKQIKTQLNEFEMSIDKCTRDLEVLHSAVCTTTCSSPSEDVSIRDQINPRSPSVSDECDVPLQQLARLKEKLIKHSRAEDAAVKRIRDLEMELVTFRQDLNEIQNERDLLQDQVSEQLILISSLQMRLDDQRLRADQIQKQTNTSLEARIYDLENEVKDLVEIINSKDKLIKQLNKVVDETKTKLHSLEQEIKSNEDYKIIEKLQNENASLLAKINNDAQNVQVLPNLVDNILADKNKDIEILRTKLNKTEAELNLYQSLNFDHEQLKALSRLQGSDRAFSDILSLIDIDTRKTNKTCESLNASYELPYKYKHNQHEASLGAPEISSIEKVGEQRNIYYSMEAPLTKPNSTEIKSAEKKRVHFEDTTELVKLKNELQRKEEVITDYIEKFKVLARLETTVEELQYKLNNTEKALADASETFEKEQIVLKEVRVELAEKKMHLIDKERQLELYVQDATRKDQMYIVLAKEKRQLEVALENQNAANERIKELENNLLKKQNDLDKLNVKLATFESVDSQLKQHNEINAKLTKDMRNLESQCDLLNQEITDLKQIIDERNNEIKHLQSAIQAQETLEDRIKELKNLVVDKDTEIEILNEDANHYQEDLVKLENKIKTLTSSTNNEFEIKVAQCVRDIAAKNLQIEKLKAEVDDCKYDMNRQHELLNEKEKVIQQMTEDSKSLHVNLETIQSKLHETGNVVHLKNQLKEEQRINKQLQEDLQRLRTDLECTKPVDMTSIDEITGAVRKQLDYSAHLDSNILNAVGVCDLEELLEQEKAKNVHLQEVLEKQQHEDAEMLGMLRIRLEEALKNEVQFDKVLQQERQARIFLEQQLKEIKHNRKSFNKNSLAEYHSLPNLNIQEVVKLTKELQTLLEENSRLKDKIRNLKNAKVESGANLKYTKDMLQLANEEVAKLENQIKEIRVSEMNMKEALMVCKIELEQKLREVENSRVLIGEFEHEGREMKTEINRLREQLVKVTDKENSLKTNKQQQTKHHTSDEFLDRIKELTDISHSLLQENKKLSRTIKKLTNEKDMLQRRIVELQDLNNYNLPFDDPIARANHLFGRYLRSESYRKALIFQKKYLIELLTSYQVQPFILHQLTPNVKKRRPVSFKIVAVSIIAIRRMQYLVQRWNSGKRAYRQPLCFNIPRTSSTNFYVGQPVSSQNFPSKSRNRSSTVINPISNFSQTSCVAETSGEDETLRPAASPTPNELEPYSGSTPPTKDTIPNFRMSDFRQRKSNTAGPSDTDVQMHSLHLLNQYVEKFNEIQRLGSTNFK